MNIEIRDGFQLTNLCLGKPEAPLSVHGLACFVLAGMLISAVVLIATYYIEYYGIAENLEDILVDGLTDGFVEVYLWIKYDLKPMLRVLYVFLFKFDQFQFDQDDMPQLE
ncbi:hypothetical protein SBOR_4281 [Sclerotinia borealis F-4128]|uniref:Uncharacterized protein n=1 Tax=Sclerotinia borealis (strain F-4128) TaxID=1432307 RepID=W9CF40_SCLBF|nr:hypothetical protein SBOR_4281 [Sclerotinia borealis F-4128]